MTRACCTLSLLAALALVTSAAEAQKPRAERPTYSLGDKWIRSDGVYDLIRIEKDLYVFAADGGREVHLTKELAVARTLRGGQVETEFSPPPRLTWPLEVGKWGVSTGVSRNVFLRTIYGSDPKSGFQATFTWKVETYEDVNVAAGTLKAFRISFSIDARLRSNLPPLELQMWYAPEARQFVKAEGQSAGLMAFQVVAIDRPATAPLQVALNDPKDQAQVTTDAIIVAGKVTSGSGVSRVTITLNGKEVSRQEERTPKKEVATKTNDVESNSR